MYVVAEVLFGYYLTMFKRVAQQVAAWSRFRKIRAWYRKYERYLLPLALMAGFIGDLIAVRAINLDIVRLILLGHLILAGTGIIIVNLPEQALRGRITRYIRLFTPLVIQYAFGALFSIFIVLYSHSGSLMVSWPFILALALLFVGTEVFKKQYEYLIVQMSVFAFALLSYMILFLPYILRSVNTIVFIASGVVSALILYGYFTLAERFAPAIYRDREMLAKGIGAVFAVVYILYFFNMIPPFPLSLREANIYYNVERVAEGYRVTDAVEEAWYEPLLPFDIVYTAVPGGTLFAFSAVFAPTNLNTDIVHEWQYYDPDNGWIQISKVEFPIEGGRSGGYRGYSYHSGVSPGWWRVSIETPQGKVIGTKRFRVVESDDVIQTKTELRR